MNQKKMQVLYIEQTGHILAAFTRTAAETLVDVKSLAGTDLIVRNEKITPDDLNTNPDRGETLSVPMDLLKAEIVDLNENAFVMPFNFMVGGGEANDLRSSVPPDTPTLTQADITIKVSAEVAQETKVWAQILEKDPALGDEPIRRIVSGVIAPKNTSTGSDGKSVKLLLKPRPDDQPASIPTPSATKKYYVLVLVAGRQPLFKVL